MIRAAVLRADPPLDPTGEQARALLRRELLRPEYRDQDLVSRVFDWITERLDRALQLASGSPPLATFVAMVLLVLLALAAGWLVSRVRRSRAAERGAGAALTDERVTARELRARADRAMSEGRHADALIDGFRALALGQVERGRVEDVPGATAHELATAIGAAAPQAEPRVRSAAAAFDEVLYGDRPATRTQAESVLSLADDLGGDRVGAR